MRWLADDDLVPLVVWAFFKLITPFIDPLTREKLKFNEDMRQYVPSEQLWTEFNGSLEFEYDHSVYWPALMELARERREARMARWVAGGKHIGELEEYLGGSVAQGIAPPAKVEAALPAEHEAKNEGVKVAVAEIVGKASSAESAADNGKPEDLKVEGLKLEDKIEEKAGPETPVETAEPTEDKQ